MEAYQQRVIDEKTELDGRLSKLTDFIASDKFHRVPSAERHRMERQQGIMILYARVLEERINEF